MRTNELVSDQLKRYIDAGYSLVHMQAHETHYPMQIISGLATTLGWNMRTWTLAAGWAHCPMHSTSHFHDDKKLPGSYDPVEPLRNIMGYFQNIDPSVPCNKWIQNESQRTRTIYVLNDYHAFLDNREVQSALKILIHTLHMQEIIVVILGPHHTIPQELDTMISTLEVPYPTAEELGENLDSVCHAMEFALSQESPGKKISVDDFFKVSRDAVISAACGMTMFEAEGVFAVVLSKHREFNSDAILDIQKEKSSIIRKTGLLEVIQSAEFGMHSIGGLDRLKDWLDGKKLAFIDKARAEEYGLPPIKGVMIVGIPGGGKSLTAKAISESWGLPLLRLDPGRVFGHYIGQSEAQIRKVCALAEAVSPCVLWVDEIEKGLSGSNSNTDSGTTSRVIGTLLTWMQEHTKPICMVATANSVTNMLPELIRRFDEVFSVDIPNTTERREIWTIHLTKPRMAHKGRKITDFDLEALVAATEGYTGAEIEKAFLAGLSDAFRNEAVKVQTKHIMKAIPRIKPIIRVMGDEIAKVRQWCALHATPSSSPDAVERAPAPAPSSTTSTSILNRRMTISNNDEEKT